MTEDALSVGYSNSWGGVTCRNITTAITAIPPTVVDSDKIYDEASGLLTEHKHPARPLLSHSYATTTGIPANGQYQTINVGRLKRVRLEDNNLNWSLQQSETNHGEGMAVTSLDYQGTYARMNGAWQP